MNYNSYGGMQAEAVALITSICTHLYASVLLFHISCLKIYARTIQILIKDIPHLIP